MFVLSVIYFSSLVSLLAYVQPVACLGTLYLHPYCATFCWKLNVGFGDLKINVFFIMNYIPLWFVEPGTVLMSLLFFAK